MLLQAPAESVTQSVVYAQQNHMGNGMYVNQALFIASIIFSLGDMLISLFKLARWGRKGGRGWGGGGGQAPGHGRGRGGMGRGPND